MNPANPTATPAPAPGSNRRTAVAAMIALALVTIAVFWPVGECGFTNMDDPAFIYANPNVRAGLTVDGFLWAFNNDHWSWHPVTWLSHMLDCELFGANPAGHHYMSLSIHALNSLLLFGILRSLDQALGAAPDMVEPLTAGARTLAAHGDDTIRDGRRALELAQRACKLTENRSAQALDVLAAAKAELGDFDGAILSAQKAIEVATQTGNKRLADQIRKRLAGYETGKPYRPR